ncbi:unnamed protein product [Ectocarpus sp. 4 AP-2014]
MIPEYARWGFTAFFSSHLLITLLLDVQAISIGENFPQVLKGIMEFHVETNNDYFMAKPTAPWFAALVWLELLCQVPFFVFATVGFVRRWNAVRIPCIIYGTSAFTSVVPIIGDILASEEVTDPQRYKLICIYLPWLILPLVLALMMASSPTPFGPGSPHSRVSISRLSLGSALCASGSFSTGASICMEYRNAHARTCWRSFRGGDAGQKKSGPGPTWRYPWLGGDDRVTESV